VRSIIVPDETVIVRYDTYDPFVLADLPCFCLGKKSAQ
jgi:hypothetical protein